LQRSQSHHVMPAWETTNNVNKLTRFVFFLLSWSAFFPDDECSLGVISSV
jgi:hypothetical protein